MGTRIHKVMGWGFQHCKFKNDPRFNFNFFDDSDSNFLPAMVKENNQRLNSSRKESHRFNEAEVFNMWVTSTGCFSKQELPEEIFTYHAFKYNNYLDINADRGPVIFSDPTHPSWNRYDDVIDYYESKVNVDGYPVDTVKQLLDSCGQLTCPYPHHLFINRKTGNILEKAEIRDRSLTTRGYFESGERCPDWKVHQKNYNLKSIIEWQRDVVPQPSYFIRLFCEVAKPFKDPMTVYRLKPMIFTYWS